ncbi:hypothetical protein POVWA1_006890 [Plasmodium ovale wallikeri]|uniref:Uncharacterized protein n=1 Tax=Plasmodium ovale wallikeri TaxID=864142 RepID=A0A1A8YIL0_PLAOA|nr:hypothetical protein POVWA1_006890 [Plasmodium ovale wallikeri]
MFLASPIAGLLSCGCAVMKLRSYAVTQFYSFDFFPFFRPFFLGPYFANTGHVTFVCNLGKKKKKTLTSAIQTVIGTAIGIAIGIAIGTSIASANTTEASVTEQFPYLPYSVKLCIFLYEKLNKFLIIS